MLVHIHITELICCISIPASPLYPNPNYHNPIPPTPSNNSTIFSNISKNDSSFGTGIVHFSQILLRHAPLLHLIPRKSNPNVPDTPSSRPIATRHHFLRKIVAVIGLIISLWPKLPPTLTNPSCCLHLVATHNPFCSSRFSGANYSEWIFLSFFLFLFIWYFFSFLFSRRIFWESAGRYQWCLGCFINWDGTLKRRWLFPASLGSVARVYGTGHTALDLIYFLFLIFNMGHNFRRMISIYFFY